VTVPAGRFRTGPADQFQGPPDCADEAERKIGAFWNLGCEGLQRAWPVLTNAAHSARAPYAHTDELVSPFNRARLATP
jgi:hypothetical protein